MRHLFLDRSLENDFASPLRGGNGRHGVAEHNEVRVKPASIATSWQQRCCQSIKIRLQSQQPFFDADCRLIAKIPLSRRDAVAV